MPFAQYDNTYLVRCLIRSLGRSLSIVRKEDWCCFESGMNGKWRLQCLRRFTKKPKRLAWENSMNRRRKYQRLKLSSRLCSSRRLSYNKKEWIYCLRRLRWNRNIGKERWSKQKNESTKSAHFLSRIATYKDFWVLRKLWRRRSQVKIRMNRKSTDLIFLVFITIQICMIINHISSYTIRSS